VIRAIRALAPWVRAALALACLAMAMPAWACSQPAGHASARPQPGALFAQAHWAFVGHVLDVGPAPPDWELGPRVIRLRVDHWFKGNGPTEVEVVDPGFQPCETLEHIGRDRRPERLGASWTVFVEPVDGRNEIVYACDRALAVTTARVSGDHARLDIETNHGVRIAAPQTMAEQVGFDNVQISPDGRHVGWTVLTPNCCTSYLLPDELVIHDGVRIVRIVGPATPPIFAWAFAADGEHLVVRQEFAHGDGPRMLHLVRLSDGVVRASFECNAYRPEGPRCDRAPQWARALAVADTPQEDE
jgi:hypothetical protein